MIGRFESRYHAYLLKIFPDWFDILWSSFNSKFHVFLELDLIPGFVTFFSCLFWALEYGTLIGIGAHVILVLLDIARPTVKVFPTRVR